MEKVVSIKALHERSSDRAYWLSRSPEERLAAVEDLRQRYLALRADTSDVSEGFQRVYRIVKLKQRQSI